MEIMGKLGSDKLIVSKKDLSFSLDVGSRYMKHQIFTINFDSTSFKLTF